MPVDDAAHIGQSNAGPFEIFRPVQSLKNAKQFMRVLHVETYAIVMDEKNMFSVS